MPLQTYYWGVNAENENGRFVVDADEQVLDYLLSTQGTTFYYSDIGIDKTELESFDPLTLHSVSVVATLSASTLLGDHHAGVGATSGGQDTSVGVSHLLSQADTFEEVEAILRNMSGAKLNAASSLFIELEAGANTQVYLQFDQVRLRIELGPDRSNTLMMGF